MNFVHPVVRHQTVSTFITHDDNSRLRIIGFSCDLPQYAHLLPKYLPTKGTRTMVRSNSNCCRLSRHCSSASEYSSSDKKSDSVVDSDGNEATSSSDADWYEELYVEGTM
jgi:hypothetical protein